MIRASGVGLLLGLGLAGCGGGLLSSNAPVSHAYVLRPAVAAPPAAPGEASPVSIRVLRAQAAPGLDTDRMLILGADGRLDFFSTGHWAGTIPDLVTAQVVETLRGSNQFAAVLGDSSPFPSENVLVIDVRRFEAQYASPDAAPMVHVVLDCKLGRRSDRLVLAAFVAEGHQAASENRLSSVVAAYDAAFGQALGTILERVRTTTVPSPPSAGKPST